MSGEHVLICVAWPYANGPLHLGHVAGCYLPPDIHARYERAQGNRVLMVSGSDDFKLILWNPAKGKIFVEPMEENTSKIQSKLIFLLLA